LCPAVEPIFCISTPQKNVVYVNNTNKLTPSVNRGNGSGERDDRKDEIEISEVYKKLKFNPTSSVRRR